MKIVLRKRIGRLKISLVIGMITDVSGVNSTLEDGNHIIMWDFDTAALDEVRGWLRGIQQVYQLPTIYIAFSSNNHSFHAYCLTRMPWLQTVSIVAATGGIDPGYVAMCAMRGHWTLRLSDKGKGAPRHAYTLPWPVVEQATLTDLKSWVTYEVWNPKTLLEWGRKGL